MIGTLIAAVSVILIVLTHLVGTIWWMSKINTSLSFMVQAVASIKEKIDDHSKDFFLKEDAERQIAKRDRDMELMWKAIHSKPK